MKKIAIIGGSGFTRFSQNGLKFILRHGNNVPPHKVNHKANLLSCKEWGADQIIGINSVGSLKKEIAPGHIVIPDDYIQLGSIDTFHDDSAVHITPELNDELRQLCIQGAKILQLPVIEKGVYFQTNGPRLETQAEIRMIQSFADIVGMTLGSEATLAKELGIPYASICMVDNYANGVDGENVSVDEIFETQKENKKNLERLLSKIL